MVSLGEKGIGAGSPTTRGSKASSTAARSAAWAWALNPPSRQKRSIARNRVATSPAATAGRVTEASAGGAVNGKSAPRFAARRFS